MKDDFKEFIKESRPTNIMEFLSKLGKTHPDVEKMVDLWSQIDGFAALYRTKDGNAYEVTVRPAEYAKHPGIKNKTKKK